MAKVKVIPAAQAAKIMIRNQMLFPAKAITAAEIIRKIGYVQIDTLAVVARAHHHVLWSRDHSYRENELDELLRKKKVFEYWSHAASYLPMEDYRYSLVLKKKYLDGHSHWFQKNKKLMKEVLKRIREEGPMQSKDFETDRKRQSWFDWKPAKIALEQLFMEGELMVSERKGFQKVYDLTERVIPDGTDTTFPSSKEYDQYLIRLAAESLGIFSLKDVVYLRKTDQNSVKQTLTELTEQGYLEHCTIEGSDQSHWQRCSSLRSRPSELSGVRILSPFDNLLIRRDRIRSVFNWSYQLECYLPEAKRKFGYFGLPLLYHDRFVGQIDTKADRNRKLFVIKNLEFSGKEKFTDLKDALITELRAFAAFNGCEEFEILNTVPLKLRGELKRSLK